MKDRLGYENLLSPEEIEGHDFRIPSIKWSGLDYELHGLQLPYEWKNKILRLSKQDPEVYCTQLNRLCQGRQINWELQLDEKTGLITEVRLSNNKDATRVYLDRRLGRSGIYSGENIQSLHTAVIYQNFLANYLGFLTNFNNTYSYIERQSSGYCSVDLTVPQEVIGSEKTVTNEHYQRQFELKASNITGQFGTDLRYVKFDEKGLLKIIQIDSDDCHYILDRSFRSYGAHNVDNIFQAATLHAIVAEYLNDLLKNKES